MSPQHRLRRRVTTAIWLPLACLFLLSACTPRNDDGAADAPTADATTDAGHDARTPGARAGEPTPSKAGGDVSQAHEKDDGAPNATKHAPRTEKELYGAWLLDRDATLENLPPIQKKSMTPIVQEMTLALIFGSGGTLDVRGVVMGVSQEEKGHFELQRVEDQVLAIRIYRDSVLDDDGAVIRTGASQEMFVEFIDDDTVFWYSDRGESGEPAQDTPGELSTMVLTRNDGDLEEKFERARAYDDSHLRDASANPAPDTNTALDNDPVPDAVRPDAAQRNNTPTPNE